MSQWLQIKFSESWKIFYCCTTTRFDEPKWDPFFMGFDVMFLKATPGLASLLTIQLATWFEISPFLTHLSHQLLTTAKCLMVGSSCKGLLCNWFWSWPNILSSHSPFSITTKWEPLSCIQITTSEFLSWFNATRSPLVKLSLANLIFRGFIKSGLTLDKKSSSSGYLDGGGFHFFSFGT